MQMPLDEPLRRIRAPSFQWAGTTDVRCRSVDHAFPVSLDLFTDQRLAGRAAEDVRCLLIMKLTAVEHPAIALVVDSAVDWYVRHNALRLARFGLLTV